MNKKLWVGGYIASLAIVAAALFFEAVFGVLLFDEIVRPEQVAVGMIAIGVLTYLQFVLVHTVVTLVVLYKLWDVIQDGVTPVTPGKAVGFLFIPFYNIYWIFRVWGGYPKDHNDFIDRNRLASPKLPGTIFTLFPVLVLLTAIFVLPIFLLPFVTIFLISRSCDAVNNLLLARTAAAEGRPISQASFIGTAENPRSRMPVYAFAGILAIAGFLFIGFGIFSSFNLFPKASAEVVPAKVGDFTLQPGGTSSGSFLGRRSGFHDRIYLMESGSSKKVLDYNVDLFASDIEPKRWIRSMCSSDPGGPIKDAAGNEVGMICSSTGAVFLQNGTKTVRIRQPFGYESEKFKAAGATSDEMVAFAKALPLNADLVFPALATSSSVTTTSTTTTSSPGTSTVSKDAIPDFTMTADEFYKASKAPNKTSMAQYAGKIIQVTGRFYSTTTNSVMLQAGPDTFWGGFETAEAASFDQAKQEDRLVIKCVGEVGSDLKLTRCILVENKKIISPDDIPDFTFTSDQFWDTVASYNLPSATRSKKWDELRGKIIKITGKAKNAGGDMANLAAGDNNSIRCEPDPENQGMFTGLTEGQNVTFLSVHGVTSLEHCIVISK